ncbi:uncharacterized protein LOC134191272 isoform X2 [Corticium candelabrum]|uniref:uncharacterized protein LOC134191272 isoform X2 n=1 Tax=Corticium candelabrum TaxID=121492 RepID=UPI002E2533E8|nr:uncharacterized protein LOC134191272 isoform X2 [Corticium candelabrum]
MDTNAVRMAFEASRKVNGGMVLFAAPGIYLTGAFNISSNTVVFVDKNAIIQGSSNGYGTIDGNGMPWWKCAHDIKKPPCNDHSRPHLVMLVEGENIEISNIEMKNSPSWTLHLAKCSHVHVHNVTFHNPSDAPNADGIDVDCSQDVVVEDCTLDVGDDALCVKSGKDWFGRTFGSASKNIVFQNNMIYHGHGITIGSEMSAGIRNVTFINITMDGTSNGVRLKSQRGRGGVVRDVVYKNITMKNIGTSIDITLNYHHGMKPTNATATPKFERITLEQVSSNHSNVGFLIDGIPESPIKELRLINVDVDAEKILETCEYVEGSCANCSYCPKCIK